MTRPALSLLLALLFALPAAAASPPGEVRIGQTLREATMQGLNGPARRLSQYRGKPLIINVWASWCGPCREEMASLERLAWLGLTPTFAIIGISTDDEASEARRFMQQANATINHYIDTRLELETMLGATHLPLTLLVDAQGRVLAKIYGSRDWDSAASQQLIRAAFSAAPGK